MGDPQDAVLPAGFPFQNKPTAVDMFLSVCRTEDVTAGDLAENIFVIKYGRNREFESFLLFIPVYSQGR